MGFFSNGIINAYIQRFESRDFFIITKGEFLGFFTNIFERYTENIAKDKFGWMQRNEIVALGLHELDEFSKKCGIWCGDRKIS